MRQSGQLRVVLLVGFAFSALGCGSDAPSTAATSTTAHVPAAAGATTIPPTSVGANPYFAGLCDVLDAVRSGDLATARSTFDHGPLHELADTVIDIDRSVAARLLEAKEAVEADLADDQIAVDQIAADLLTLTNATRTAYTAAGQPTPAPCDQETP